MVEGPAESAAAERPPVEICELVLVQLFNLLTAFKRDFSRLHTKTHLRRVCLGLLTTMVDSCRKAKPLLRCVCLSLIRRMFDGDRVANGAKADKMESREV